MDRWSSHYLLIALAFLVIACCRRGEPVEVLLATAGKPRLSVVVAPKASERVRQTARTLADYLGRISETKFEVRAGDGRQGIAVGLPANFPTASLQKLWDATDPTRTEDYLLRSHAGGLYVVGASELAVENAVWDLLYRLGHRQFFPGPTWEVIPRLRDLRIAVEAREHPSYFSRRIWYGFGAPRWSAGPYADWCSRNRAVSGIAIKSGHAYPGIVSRNRAEFARHPEYHALVGGERKSAQFCISNPGLRKLVVEDTLKQFEKTPGLPCVSLEPADGSGWCECDNCRRMGRVTDRVITLANEAAAAVEAKFPGRYIGVYAYSEHSPPPTIKVHPRVVVNVATGFIRGGYTVEQLLKEWRKQDATLGIREYYSVHPWDRDLPGKAHGADPGYLGTTTPRFHDLGARFLSAESSDNWGCNGLGYYLAARMLWDVREAGRLEALKADFLEKAFGPAREPMREFYRLIDHASRPLPTDDLVGRMYRSLDAAWRLTSDAGVRGRLHDLILYTRYVEHWLDYAAAAEPARQQAFEAMVRHAYRMRKTMMIHTVALVRDLPRRDRTITLPAQAAYNIPEAKNPWLSNEPFPAAELERIVAEGIARRKLFDFQPVAFGKNLVSAGKLGLPAVKDGSAGLTFRGVHTFYTLAEGTADTIHLRAKGGIVYVNRGPAQVQLFAAAETEGKPVAEAVIPPDRQEHEITLKTTFPGLHRLEMADRTAGTYVAGSPGRALTVPATPEAPAVFVGRWSLYFYVPKGTKVVGGYAAGAGALLDGSGKQIHLFDKRPAYFSVPVPPGQDGKLWKLHNSLGQRLLLTVPPFLARNGQELLLPAEVVEPRRPR